MKTMIIAFAFGTVMGAGLAYTNTADHYEDKARALREATAKAEQVRADKAQGEVDELFEKWRNALNVEPVTVTERVYVRGKCSVPADQSREVGNGANADRIEIEERIVRGVERVALKHESLYKKCAVQLRAAQALLKAE